MNRCTNCQALLDQGSKFCTSCGTPVQQRELSSIPSRKNACPNCGMSTPPGAQFCTQCGTRNDGQSQIKNLKAGGTEGQSRFLKWNQRIWDVVTMVGSIAMAAVWYYYSSLRTPPDKKTCVAMVGLPLMLIVFRPLTDRLLIPLQTIRQKIPKNILLGIGLASPFLVSNYYYSTGSQNFPYMFKTFVTSVLLSYVILRNPLHKKL